MAKKTKLEAIADIKTYIIERGGSYSNWYVGISKDARDRLFNGHSVDEKNDPWIYVPTVSSDAARSVEDHFINTLGTDGGSGGGDDDSDMVYSYKKSTRTNP